MPIIPGLVREWSGHASKQLQDIYTHQLKRGIVRLGDHVEYRLVHFVHDPAVAARYQALRQAYGTPCAPAPEMVPPVVPNSGRSRAVA